MAAGATQVFSGEGEVALSMAVAMLLNLGATPDQIDRERARVQADLFSKTAAAQRPTAPIELSSETPATVPTP